MFFSMNNQEKSPVTICGYNGKEQGMSLDIKSEIK